MVDISEVDSYVNFPLYHFLKIVRSVLEKNKGSQPGGLSPCPAPLLSTCVAQPLGASPLLPALDFDFWFFDCFIQHDNLCLLIR